ncbi:MAG TPA: hypothetical protein VHO06_22440 [Polyangia bacterium]|nr:hypothetical protein [Polyangia bacterium]
MSPETADAVLDRLFAVRPADFVKERTALVKALKAAGRREEAAGVEKLPRPTPSVWAVNQLARHVPALVQRLGEATARLQEGGAGSYADALAAHRDVLTTLRAKAEEILEAAELRPTPDVLTRVVYDLRAGVLDPRLRPLVEGGRLARDVAGEGAVNPFEQELPERPAASLPAPAPERDAEAARQAAARAEEERVARLRRLKTLREAVAAAETACARDERAAEVARRDLGEAERRLAAARAALAAATAALAAAESEARSR